MTEDQKRHSAIMQALSETHAATSSTNVEIIAARKQLTELTTQFALHEQNDHHVHEAHDSRISGLENRAEASGAHDITALQTALDQRDKQADVWKGRVWAIFATLFLTAAVGLVTHYISTH